MNATEQTPPTAPLRPPPATSAVATFDGPAGHMREIAEAIVRRIRARPLTSLAAAIGVGFVVGGALSFRAGRVVLAAAVRNVARELLKQVL
jgi:H+/gluconate symporter-like permease